MSVQRLVCEGFAARGVEAVPDGERICLPAWPGFDVDEPFVAEQTDTMVRLDFFSSLDAGQEDTSIYAQAVGFGGDAETALADAVDQWLTGVAAPMLSAVRKEPMWDTQRLPAGSAFGLDGWECYAGPTLVRGDPVLVPKVAAAVEKQPLITLVKDGIAPLLDRQRRFDSVALFVAHSYGEVFADARIGIQPRPDLAEGLNAFSIPVEESTWWQRLWRPRVNARYYSARQFIVCVRQPDGGN